MPAAAHTALSARQEVRPMPRRNRRPATAPAADLGPAVRLQNHTAVVTYRADPERPSAPLIRAARAYHAWEWMEPPLSVPQQNAAARIEQCAAQVSGSATGEGGGGRAWWDRGMPSGRIEAARYLREVTQVLGRYRELAVLSLVVDGVIPDEHAARDGLSIMADYWHL